MHFKLQKNIKKILKGYGINGLIKGKEVHFDDGRIISTPIDWHKPLKQATLSELKNYKLICKNTGIEWKNLDYHLNIESMLQISEKRAA